MSLKSSKSRGGHRLESQWSTIPCDRCYNRGYTIEAIGCKSSKGFFERLKWWTEEKVKFNSTKYKILLLNLKNWTGVWGGLT